MKYDPVFNGSIDSSVIEADLPELLPENWLITFSGSYQGDFLELLPMIPERDGLVMA